MKSFFSGVGRLGFDIGGTFVDFTLIDNQGNIYTKKVLSTPDDYSRGVSIGIHELLNETKINSNDPTDIYILTDGDINRDEFNF